MRVALTLVLVLATAATALAATPLDTARAGAVSFGPGAPSGFTLNALFGASSGGWSWQSPLSESSPHAKGATVKTLRIKAAPMSEWSTSAWSTKTKGVYTYAVTIKDEVGNAQRKAGVARMTVR